jgi:dTDP-4-amino-4,6-dideoxygalactose transaminase|tara:strand:+ start:956 stop:2116 length:1161 start_codon:yes stop_codon:yes gene_type:complete
MINNIKNMEKIPIFAPYVTDDITKLAVENALTEGFLGMGGVVNQFEETIKNYLELKDRYVVSVNTGTSALHCAVELCDIEKGDEVIVPSFNFAADQVAIEMAGAKVVMCDIRDDNLGIDCKKAEELITEKTKAIMPLHFAGIPCDQNGVYDLAKKHNLRVIEDGTHAFGTSINNKKIGSYGDISCFSFDPVKIITAVDGGCIIVNSEEEVKKLKKLRLLGISTDPMDRAKGGKLAKGWDYEIESKGFRYHMNTITATIGISQIKRIEDFISSRRRICQKYNEAFKDIPNLKIPETDYSNVSPFIYYLRMLNGEREKLQEYLIDQNIDTGINFIPVHNKAHFKNCKRGDMTVTDKVASEIFHIPLHSHMQKDFVDRVINGINGFFNK